MIDIDAAFENLKRRLCIIEGESIKFAQNDHDIPREETFCAIYAGDDGTIEVFKLEDIIGVDSDNNFITKYNTIISRKKSNYDLIKFIDSVIKKREKGN